MRKEYEHLRRARQRLSRRSTGVIALRLELRLQLALEGFNFADMERSDSTEAKLSKIRGHDCAAVRGHLFPPVAQRGQQRGKLAFRQHCLVILLGLILGRITANRSPWLGRDGGIAQIDTCLLGRKAAATGPRP